MNHEKYMRIAIEEARTGIETGQTPFGSCIVKDGEVISASHNHVWASTDITAHAEIDAIRDACKRLNTIDLSGCIIYSTCEPCPMCYSAIHWARISTIVYGARIEDAEKGGFNEIPISNEQLKELGEDNVELIKDYLREECTALFGEWKEGAKSRSY